MLGIPRAIIENVVFCHQEEANWPLEDVSNSLWVNCIESRIKETLWFHLWDYKLYKGSWCYQKGKERKGDNDDCM